MFTICRTGPYLSTVQQQLQHGQHCLQRRRAAAHQAAGGAGRIVHTGAEAKPRFGRVFNGSMMNDYIYFVHIYIYKQYIISSIYIAHIYIYSFPTSLCGVLVLILYPASSSTAFASASARHLCHPQLCHTHTQYFTHHFVTHHLSHTTLSATIFHTQLCHPPSFTYNFVTHHLSHTTLSHTIFHTPSFTQHFVTHHPSHTTLSHTIFHTPLCHPPSFTHTHTPLCHLPSFAHHLLHTIFHTHTTLSQLFCHPPSFTHNFVTH